MIPGGPLSRHLFVYSLIHFIMCSITYGTLRAAPNPDMVYVECGSLTFATYVVMFIRANYIPVIIGVCFFYKNVTRYALMIDAYVVTVILCIELFVCSIQLTRVGCYHSLKTDPDQGTAVFVNAMEIVIAIDACRLLYFIISREQVYHVKPITGDEEIELLLQEIDDTPAIQPDEEEEEEIRRKKPTKPVPATLKPGFG